MKKREEEEKNSRELFAKLNRDFDVLSAVATFYIDSATPNHPPPLIPISPVGDVTLPAASTMSQSSSVESPPVTTSDHPCLSTARLKERLIPNAVDHLPPLVPISPTLSRSSSTATLVASGGEWDEAPTVEASAPAAAAAATREWDCHSNKAIAAAIPKTVRFNSPLAESTDQKKKFHKKKAAKAAAAKTAAPKAAAPKAAGPKAAAPKAANAAAPKKEKPKFTVEDRISASFDSLEEYGRFQAIRYDLEKEGEEEKRKEEKKRISRHKTWKRNQS